MPFPATAYLPTLQEYTNGVYHLCSRNKINDCIVSFLIHDFLEIQMISTFESVPLVPVVGRDTHFVLSKAVYSIYSSLSSNTNDFNV